MTTVKLAVASAVLMAGSGLVLAGLPWQLSTGVALLMVGAILFATARP